MAVSEQEIEKEIQAKGKTAPRLTPDMIDSKIVLEHYWIVPGTAMTVCALVLENGYVVIGRSAPASSENFDESLGRRLAMSDARNKIWPLEGYLLRDRLKRGA